jgi:hypothetical protein
MLHDARVFGFLLNRTAQGVLCRVFVEEDDTGKVVEGVSSKEISNNNITNTETDVESSSRNYIFTYLNTKVSPYLAPLLADFRATMIPDLLDVSLPIYSCPAANIGLPPNAPHFEKLMLLTDNQPPIPQFYVGGPGSGAPFHHHEDAVNSLIHGRKHWYLTPPQYTTYSTVSIADHILHGLMEEEAHSMPRPLECTQESGDVIYVPRDWGHAVLNLAPSIGYAVEFCSAYRY